MRDNVFIFSPNADAFYECNFDSIANFVGTSMAIKEKKKERRRERENNETERTQARLTVCEEKMTKRSRN